MSNNNDLIKEAREMEGDVQLSLEERMVHLKAIEIEMLGGIWGDLFRIAQILEIIRERPAVMEVKK